MKTVNPKKIKKIRTENGITAQQVADKAGISIRTVFNIEKGDDVYVSTYNKYYGALLEMAE